MEINELVEKLKPLCKKTKHRMDYMYSSKSNDITTCALYSKKIKLGIFSDDLLFILNNHWNNKDCKNIFWKNALKFVNRYKLTKIFNNQYVETQKKKKQIIRNQRTLIKYVINNPKSINNMFKLIKTKHGHYLSLNKIKKHFKMYDCPKWMNKACMRIWEIKPIDVSNDLVRSPVRVCNTYIKEE